QFVALARVSSREQEREGFSLEVQEEALKRYAEAHGGVIIKLFKIAETASKRDERKTFKEMITFAKKHCVELDGLLFYKVDRAARNLFDYENQTLEGVTRRLAEEGIKYQQGTPRFSRTSIHKCSATDPTSAKSCTAAIGIRANSSPSSTGQHGIAC